jgi:hypothetical protein
MNDRRLGRLRVRDSSARRRRSPWVRVIGYLVALALVIHVMILLNDKGTAIFSDLIGRIEGKPAPSSVAPTSVPVPLPESIAEPHSAAVPSAPARDGGAAPRSAAP